MKHNIIFTKLITMVLPFFIITCTTSNTPENSQPHKKLIEEEGDYYDYEIYDYEDFNVCNYVTNNPEVFPHKVLIFETDEEADSLLDVMQDVDYDELREMYSQLGHYNPTIEAEIKYDSILKVIVENEYGIQVEQIEDKSDESISQIFTDVESKIISDSLSQYFYWYEESTDNQSIRYMFSDGIMDLRALANQDSIVIIDKTVYKFFSHTILSVPVPYYKYLMIYDELAMISLEESNAILYDNNGNIIEYGVSHPTIRRVVGGEGFPSHYENARGAYKTIVDIRSYDTFPWFGGTKRHNEATISNFICRYSCTNTIVGTQCEYDYSYYIPVKLKTTIFDIKFNAISYDPEGELSSHWYHKTRNKKTWTLKKSGRYFYDIRNRNAYILFQDVNIDVYTGSNNNQITHVIN